MLRSRLKSLPDSSSNFGSDEPLRESELSHQDSVDLSPVPATRGGTMDHMLQGQESSRLISENALNFGWDMSHVIEGLSDKRDSAYQMSFEGLSFVDVSRMPLQEADKVVRKWAQSQFHHFFQSLKATQQLQAQNVARVNDEIIRIKHSIDKSDRECTDCEVNFQQACEARDIAQANEQRVQADVMKHKSLRTICENNDFSEAIRFALAQVEVELENLDQMLETTAKVAEEAHERLESCEAVLQHHQRVYDSLRQEPLAAEKVQHCCQSTSSVLQGSCDEIISLSPGPRFHMII